MTQPFEYYRPCSHTEAVNLLAREDVHCLPLIIHPKPADPRRLGADAFVDLSLLGLNELQMDVDGTLHLGSLVTIQKLVDDPILSNGEFSLLSQAASLVATPGIRNLATVWGAVVAQEGPPEITLALLALDANIAIRKADESLQTFPFSQFLDRLPGSLAKTDLITEFILPPQKDSISALERVARTPRDEAIVAAAAVLYIENGTSPRVNLAVAGAYSNPQRLPNVEGIMSGQTLTPKLLDQACSITMESAGPVSDFRGSAKYRRSIAGVVVRRVLLKVWEQALLTGLVAERSDQ